MRMVTPKQVQLRGGTSEEHNNFIGASREITIDTTLNTIRVHDGLTKGGHIICKKDELIEVSDTFNERLNDVQLNIGKSHNHDDVYSKLTHNHDNTYSKLSHNHDSLYFKTISLNGYNGFSINGNDSNWVRTTKNGLIPYQSGGYSSIGTSSWRFNEGHFNTLNAHTLNMSKSGNSSKIKFSAQTNDPGYIEHYENNNTSYIRFCISDDVAGNDEIQIGSAPSGTFQKTSSITANGNAWFKGTGTFDGGYIVVNGRRIYIQSSQPSGARTGDVWFQI